MSVSCKILCLHGFAQTASVFAAKSSGIRKMLKKEHVETYYLDGPIVLTNDDLPFDASSLGAGADTEFRGWWKIDDDFDITPAVDAVKSAIKEHGPFDAVMGFSQGAALAQYLTENMSELGNTKPIKFGIYFSGFLGSNMQVNAKYLAHKISVPTLHILGESDSLVSNDRSLLIAEEYCENATVFKHPGGHYVPNQKPIVKQWVNWVMGALEGKTAQELLNSTEPAATPKEIEDPKKVESTEDAEAKKMDAEDKKNKDAAELEALGKEIDSLGI